MRVVFGCAVRAGGLFAAWMAEKWYAGCKIVVLEENESPREGDHAVDRMPWWRPSRFLGRLPALQTHFKDLRWKDRVDKACAFIERLDRRGLTPAEEAHLWVIQMREKEAVIARATQAEEIRALLPSIFAQFDWLCGVFDTEEALPFVSAGSRVPWRPLRDQVSQ